MQMLNVACGGTLDQHLPDRVGHEDHRHTPGSFSDHEVRLEPGTLAARAVGAETTAVKSHHHQGIDELGEGLTATGWSTADGLVEAVELEGKAYALGVLWHPEQDERSRLVGSLVEAAVERSPAVRR
jgi:putative glutamine amidotransferase